MNIQNRNIVKAVFYPSLPVVSMASFGYTI